MFIATATSILWMRCYHWADERRRTKASFIPIFPRWSFVLRRQLLLIAVCIILKRVGFILAFVILVANSIVEEPAAARGDWFHLSEYEQRYLLTCGRGESLIIADQNHVAVKIVASKEEHPLLTTDPVERYGSWFPLLIFKNHGLFDKKFITSL